jgi:protein-tyrosine phosphatase
LRCWRACGKERRKGARERKTRVKRSLALIAALALSPPAFAEAPAAPALAQAAAARFVVLEGGRNFRDVGGYLTADGHVVRHGLLYRSGSLGGLTAKGQQRLEAVGAGTIIDLRTTRERGEDSNLRLAKAAGYWTRDYDFSPGDFGSYFADRSKLTAENLRAIMTHGYRRFAVEQAPSYRQMFAALLATDKPVIVNCTAGKDRTGIAAALVLTALGVPYHTVRADFLLSNDAPGMETLKADISSHFAALPADVVAPLVGVEGGYLDAAFDQLRADYGSVEAYLDKELGVGPREIARLRARMLQKGA